MEIFSEGIEYFSSDYVCSLLAAEKDGSIVRFQHIPDAKPDTDGDGRAGDFEPLGSSRRTISRLTPDSMKKDVKYYPVDDHVFTTTDRTGLRVWDANEEKCLYQYKKDTLTTHDYSSECIIAAFDEYNIKFYDLRCRYAINSLKRSNVEKVGWSAGRLLYSLNEEGMLECIDYGEQKSLWSIENVSEFTTSFSGCFALTKEQNGTSLLSINQNVSGGKVLKKRSRYSHICGLKTEPGIAGLEGGEIYIEVQSGRSKLDVGREVKTLNAVYSDESMYIVLVDDQLLLYDRSALGQMTDEDDESYIC